MHNRGLEPVVCTNTIRHPVCCCRVLVALRELLPQLPPRVRFVFTTRPQPQHVVRSLAFSFGARTAYPPAPAQQQQQLLQGQQGQEQQSRTAAGPEVPNHLLSVLQPLLLAPDVLQQQGGGRSALDAAYHRIFTAQLRALGPTEVGQPLHFPGRAPPPTDWGS